MTGGGCLPFVPVETAGVQEDTRDLLLRGAGPMAIESPQHPSESLPLLACQARIRGNRASMQGGKEALNGFDPVETGETERDDGDRDRIALEGAVENLQMLPVAERESELHTGVLDREVEAPGRRSVINAVAETRRGLGQHHDTCVLGRKPENWRIGRRDQRIDGEIATPSAAGSVRSAAGGLHGRQSRLQNLRHNHRCGAAIPRPDRMRSVHPDGRIAPKNARSMRQGSSRPPESTQTNREGSGFPHGLRFGSQALVNR
ncbi:hypothetical protein SAMN05421641_11630 [Paracoccus thiocyanatus]|uniref:Uncharacterized protein n=1 Tax=Paracoccus thiocyanatus TaxID=34006 RepID=A0A1N6WA41_9RHOB|nr:hypothetical protein SAMN05421641_11630 [Paracoccus thiocyanatus]